jgi:OPA family glycerol-3-phosphate transporter-like MFS transporter
VKSRKQTNGLVLLFAATYMISYITRINYGAIISEMQTATGFSKSLLSMSLTGSFITYGLGQVVSGICGDKISPKKLVLWGLLATVAMNLLIPVCADPYQMLIVWSINGFAQSFMWPPIIKIMTDVLPEAEYKRAVTKVSWGSSVGTIVVYLLSPLLISVAGWRSVFVFSAALGIVMLFVWNKFATDVQAVQPREVTSAPKTGSLFTPLLFGVMVAIVLQGMLRDGVTTWMPSYIAEIYHLSNEISILTGVILPVFSILCFQAALLVYARKPDNPLVCATLFFFLGAIASVGIRLFDGQNAAVSVVLFALLTGSMHGVNLMLISMIPPYFQKTGKVSTVSGILNACTYIGSAASTYGVAVLSEKLGWNYTVLIWLVIAACGTAICLICSKAWNRYRKTLEK